ncbi:MAG: hypothetical protein PHE61_00930 [Candidatus Omnitrophica bacterium]|nr:hypothetical protein [Candidatus Omnitrophota bacterium]
MKESQKSKVKSQKLTSNFNCGGQRFLCLFVVAAILIGGLAGCADLQKKFIRKKKKEQVKPIFYQEPLRKSNMELYRDHFLYWQGWQKEFVFDLGDNHKKEMQDLYETRRHLAVLPGYLEPEFAKKLEEEVKNFDRITSSLKQGRPSDTDAAYMRKRLDALRLRVEKHFSIKDVKAHLLPDPPPIDLSDYKDEEEGPPPPGMEELKGSEEVAKQSTAIEEQVKNKGEDGYDEEIVPQAVPVDDQAEVKDEKLPPGIKEAKERQFKSESRDEEDKSGGKLAAFKW